MAGRIRSWLPYATALAMLCGGVATTATSTSAPPDMPPLTDQEISDEVQDELAFDPGVESVRIDATTTEGIVTLTGTVNHILAKERAARVAETVKGVRAVVNRIDVQPTDRSDPHIRRDVERALLEDPATDSFEILVSVEDGQVTVSGTVDSYQEASLVTTVAKGVRGVMSVTDEIDVDYQVERSDQEIEAEIEQALRWNAYVDDHLIDVSVEDGEVTLSGTAGSAAEKRLATADAWVAGVDAVHVTDLTVERWARDDDLRGDKYVVTSEEELRDAVLDALLYDPRVMSFNVDVEVIGNVVTLRGAVDNVKAKQAAGQVATDTVGVQVVNNRLAVSPEASVSDAEISESVRDALERDPSVERFEIAVATIGGTTHLYGTVDSAYEEFRARDVASRVAGVVNVESHLHVVDDVPYVPDPYVGDPLLDDDVIPDYAPGVSVRADSAIEESIEDELWWSPFVDLDDVTVSVDQGIAQLSGTVDSWSERQAATENAYEGGAVVVDNDLIIDVNDE